MRSGLSGSLRLFSGGVRGLAALVLVALLVSVALAQQDLLRSLRIVVHGGDQKPVAGAHISIKMNGTAVRSLTTNENGEASAYDLPAQTFQIAVTSPGFETLTQQIVPNKGEPLMELEVVLMQKLQKRETVIVQGQATLGESSSATQEVDRLQVKNSPARPATVADALPLMTGVVRG